MSWWYPRLNARGEIASGNGEIWKDGAAIGVAGHSPQWFGDPEDALVFIGDEARIIDTRTGALAGPAGLYVQPARRQHVGHLAPAPATGAAGTCAGAHLRRPRDRSRRGGRRDRSADRRALLPDAVSIRLQARRRSTGPSSARTSWRRRSSPARTARRGANTRGTARSTAGVPSPACRG